MKTKLTRVLCLVMTLALLLCACGPAESNTPDTSNPPNSSENTAEPGTSGGMAEVQELNVLLGLMVSTLDVNAYGYTNEYHVIGNCQEGLFRIQLDENGREVVTNAGCESYEISEDGSVYTFHLGDRYWSDGVPVKAEDYVNSYLRALTAANGFSYADKYFIVKNGERFYKGEATAEEVGIKALDDKTLEITVETPRLDIITTLVEFSFPIRMDTVEAATTTYGSNCDEVVYNGPFMVTSWVPDNSLVLEKNPYYWDAEHVYLDKINFTYVAEATTRAIMFDAKQLDIVEYNEDYGATWNARAETGEIQKVEQPRAIIEWLVFHTDGPSGVLSNAKVRKAISLSIDREMLVDTVFGRYEAAYDIVPPVVTVDGKTFNTSGEGPVKEQLKEYDTPEKLQALLKEGLDELGYEYNDLSDVTVSWLELVNSTQQQVFVEFIKQNIENTLGITVNLIALMDWSAYAGEEFDLNTVGWNANNSPDAFLYMLNPESGINESCMGNYYTDELVDLLRQAQGELDVDTYIRMYQEIEDGILEDAGVAPLFFNDYVIYEQNYVKDVQITNFGVYFDYTHAYIAAH